MADSIKLRSKVKTPLMRARLFKGTAIAALGMAALLAAGLWAGPNSSGTRGFLIFAAAIGLVTIGLIPYRRLSMLQGQPDQIILTAKYLQFNTKGKLLFTLPFTCIKDMFYEENQQRYGIGILLHKPLPEKVCTHQSGFDMDHFCEECRENHACDIFFPYFTASAFEQLEAVVEDKEDNDD